MQDIDDQGLIAERLLERGAAIRSFQEIKAPALGELQPVYLLYVAGVPQLSPRRELPTTEVAGFWKSPG